MSYFDNANTDVTRRSFGSKVDKTFQREGVIPVKDRKKEERDLVAESAKYKELNKKVDDRRMKEAKDARAYEVQLREGYEVLKDELMKDILSEICVESLLVDKPVVENNLKNIVDMIEEKVDEIGGFNGVKHIAESTNNGLLKNMVSICEATCKRVGERNLREAKGNPSLLDMKLNKVEMEEFGNRKKEIGSETIINHIKDKVFQVVKDEQEMNTNRQEIMSEIENKVMDLNGPVQEAMEYIFESHGVEEATLFDSLMRRRYKDLIKNESSVIFESMDIPGDDEEDFEDQEFAMSDIELVDEEDDEAIEDLFLRESIELLAKAYHVAEEGVINEAFDEVITRLDENAKGVRSKSQARQLKNQVRLLQEALEGLVESKVPSDPEKPDMSLAKPEKGVKKVKEEVILCPTCGKEQCTCKTVKESSEVLTEGVIKKLLKKFIKIKTNDPREMELKELKAKVENAKKLYQQNINDGTINIEEPDHVFWYSAELLNEAKRVKGIIDAMEGDANSDGEKLWLMKHYYEWLNMFEQQLIDQMVKYIKNDVAESKSKLSKAFSNCKEPAQYKEFMSAVVHIISYYRKIAGKVNLPEVDAHCKWLEEMFGKADKKSGVGKGPLVFESYLERLDKYYSEMNSILESHEMALNGVVESLKHEIDGKTTLVPYLQTKDVNLNNLELVYKTKFVCESLKDSLKNANDVNDMAVIERAVELNIQSLTESINIIKDNPEMNYKSHILKSGRKYLGRLQEVMNGVNLPYADPVTESTHVFNSADDVDRVFDMVREYYVIESTDNQLMETVMAEAIVEYTILEAFNTLRLMNFTKESVRQMARKNISSVSEGFLGKKVNVDVEVEWGGGKTLSCALLDPDNHDDSGMKGSISLPVPQRFLDGGDEGTSDKDLLDYVKKEIKKHLRKKGFKMNNIFLH